VQFSCLCICNPLILLLVPIFDSCNKWEGFHTDKSFVHTFAQQDLDKQLISFSIFFS